MGGGSTSSTQTTTQALPSGQQRNVDVMLRAALENFMGGGRQFFPGDMVADFDPLQTQGQNNIVNFAGGVGTDLIGDAISANTRLLDPSMLDPSQNPYFSAVADDITRRSTQNFNENIMPGIRSGAIAAGQFGGAPQGVATGLAEGRRTAETTGTIADLALGQQGLGLQAIMNAIRNSPMLFDLGLAPGQAIAGVGDVRQQQAQNEIQADVARHEFEQNEPLFQLQMLRDLTGRFGDFGGTTTTESEQKVKQSPVNTALGAALLGASIFNPMTSMFSGLGSTGIGSVFGNMAGGAGIGSMFGPSPTAQELLPISLTGP